jgi:hypothetical protein
MFAQALVEYSLVDTVISGLDALRFAVEGWLRKVDPATGILVGGVLFVWVVLRSFRQRGP